MECIRAGQPFPIQEHQDLWVTFETVLGARTDDDVSFIKVKAHRDWRSLDGFDAWTAFHNDKADAAAKSVIWTRQGQIARGLAAARNKQNLVRKRVAEVHAFVIRSGTYVLAELQRRQGDNNRGDATPLDDALESLQQAPGTNTCDPGAAHVLDRVKANVFGPTCCEDLQLGCQAQMADTRGSGGHHVA